MKLSSWSTTAGLFALAKLANGQAQPEFSVTDVDNFAWNQSEWSLTGTNFIPNRWQARLSLANGYVCFAVYYFQSSLHGIFSYHQHPN
jgi:hypothetical protein